MTPQFYSGMPTFSNVPDPVAPAYDDEMAQLNALLGLDPSPNGGFDARSPDLTFTSSYSVSQSQYPTPSADSFNFSWPILPTPRPDSPPSSSPAAPETLVPALAPTATKVRSERSKLDGLELANILKPGASRTRAPSSRKREAEKLSEAEQPSKRRKTQRVYFFSFVPHFSVHHFLGLIQA